MSLLGKTVRAVSRLGWSAAAQVTSNASNFVLTVLVARALDVASLGVFALLMAANGVAIGVVRAWTSEPLIFKEAVTQSFTGKSKYSASILSTATVGFGVGIASVVVLHLVSDNVNLALAFGVSIFFAVLQDSVRFCLVDSGRAAYAFGVEALWLLVEVPVILLLSPDALLGFVIAWGLGASVSVVVGLSILRPVLNFRLVVEWFRSVRSVGPIYSMDYFVAGGLTPAVTFLVSAISGLEASGWLRAAQMLLMPLSIFTLGMNFALIPEATRFVGRGDLSSARRLPAVYAVCVAGVAVVCVLAYQFLPAEISASLMGDAAIGGLAVLPFTAVALSVAAISVGPGLVLRAMGMVRASMLVKLFAAPVTLMAVAAGAAWGGATGSQIGLAGGTATRAVGSWILMESTLKAAGKSRVEESS